MSYHASSTRIARGKRHDGEAEPPWLGLDTQAAQQEIPGVLRRPGPGRHYAALTFTLKTDAERWLADERRLIERDEWTPPAARRAPEDGQGRHRRRVRPAVDRAPRPQASAPATAIRRCWTATSPSTIGATPLRDLTPEAVRRLVRRRWAPATRPSTRTPTRCCTPSARPLWATNCCRPTRAPSGGRSGRRGSVSR